MAAFTSDAQLNIRVGSAVDQADANRRLRDLFRDALRQGRSLAVVPAAPGAPITPPLTDAEIAAMSTAQARPYVQRMVKSFIRDLAKAERVRAADVAAVQAVRDAADDMEDGA